MHQKNGKSTMVELLEALYWTPRTMHANFFSIAKTQEEPAQGISQTIMTVGPKA